MLALVYPDLRLRCGLRAQNWQFCRSLIRKHSVRTELDAVAQIPLDLLREIFERCVIERTAELVQALLELNNLALFEQMLNRSALQENCEPKHLLPLHLMWVDADAAFQRIELFRLLYRTTRLCRCLLCGAASADHTPASFLENKLRRGSLGAAETLGCILLSENIDCVECLGRLVKFNRCADLLMTRAPASVSQLEQYRVLYACIDEKQPDLFKGLCRRGWDVSTQSCQFAFGRSQGAILVQLLVRGVAVDWSDARVRWFVQNHPEWFLEMHGKVVRKVLRMFLPRDLVPLVARYAKLLDREVPTYCEMAEQAKRQSR
jgi:hypothetical protein